MSYITIGLGKTGVAITDNFSQHKQYKTYQIATEKKKQKRYYCLPKQKNPENYEQIPSLKTFFRGIKGEVLFVVDGGEKVSISTLAILEQIKHCEIDILYIKPDVDLLNEEQKNIEKTVFNVLLHYARSKVFKQIYIVHKPTIENILGEIPIVGYDDKINETISSTFHMINVFKNIDSFMDNFSMPYETARISTIGFFNIEKNKEELFFPLKEIREIDLFYNIRGEILKTDGKYCKNLLEQIKEKKDGKTKISFGIYESNYEMNNAFCIARSAVPEQE